MNKHDELIKDTIVVVVVLGLLVFSFVFGGWKTSNLIL